MGGRGWDGDRGRKRGGGENNFMGLTDSLAVREGGKDSGRGGESAW